jgi:hypothetical protein
MSATEKSSRSNSKNLADVQAMRLVMAIAMRKPRDGSQRTETILGGLKELRPRVKNGFLAGVAEWQTRWIQNGLARLEATLLPHVVFR